MSIVKTALVNCSRCGKEHEITIYKSINVADDAAMKHRVLDGSLFLWNCPDCGAANLARYECLYHDPDARFMAWLLPFERVSEAEMQAISLHAKALGAYTLRRCADVGELIEKVRIQDAGLDDVAIEICKFVIRGELEQKRAKESDGPAVDPKLLHFHRQDRDGLSFTFPSGGQMTSLTIGRNVYDDALGIISRNPSLRPEEGFVQVDSAWLSTRIR